MNSIEWESVAGDTERIEVPGGWLYRVRTDCACRVDEVRLEVSVVFVPAPEAAS